MNCPDCKHPVDAHGFSYCNRTGCTCNQSHSLAQAKAERDIAQAQLERAKELLGCIRHWDMLDTASDGNYWKNLIDRAIADIEQTGVENA